MHGHPSAADLTEAVQAFLRQVESSLTGREAFHAKVAANALGIVIRELRQQPDAIEQAELSRLLGGDADLPALRTDVSERLRDGRLSAETPGLIDALIVAVAARLAVDNPKYSTLSRLGEST